jgi:hypothetical protein
LRESIKRALGIKTKPEAEIKKPSRNSVLGATERNKKAESPFFPSTFLHFLDSLC